MRVGCFSRRCLTSWTRKSNVSLFTLERFFQSKIIPVLISRCPPRTISWLILASLFPFHSNSTKHHIEQRPVLLPSFRSFDSKTSDSRFFVSFRRFAAHNCSCSVSCRALFLDSCCRSGKMPPFPTEFYLHLRLFDFSRLRPFRNRTQVQALSAPNKV